MGRSTVPAPTSITGRSPSPPIDITGQTPKKLEWETAESSDVIITMGCGDACPIFHGKRYEDWKLDDPAGKGVESVRPIRDEIKTRIEKLLAELRRDLACDPRVP